MGVTGLSIDGGVASVTRSVARAFDEETAAGRIERVDRVLLLDEVPPAPPRRGSQRLARGRHALFTLQLRLEIARRRPDLVFIDMVGLARSLQLPLPLPRAPYALFCHGIELDRATPGSRYERAVREARLLVANSQFTAARVRERHPEVGERLRVTPLCVDPARLERWSLLPPREAARREPIVLIVGRLWAEEGGKGHDQLLEGWQRVRTAVPGAQLWIVGDGDDRPRLEGRARELGVADAVRFLGHVAEAELVDAYRRAALFAMPSRQEGFGLVYAEALWHGLPCLASTADAGAEVVRDGETGRLVPYGDVDAAAEAIAGLLLDPEGLRAMGEAAGRDARERFGYERFKRDLLAALELS
jgi:phosphatidylinositol alpha-1,6-mannosyltransferase